MASRSLAAAIHSGIAAILVIVLATFAFAASPVVSYSLAPQEREATARKYVSEALLTWQKRLNLTEWAIRVELVRRNDLEPKTLGGIHWDTYTRRATIDILSPYDYNLPASEMLNDMELTIVHELVHLHLASLPRSDATRRNEEYAVNQLSRALLNLSKR
jgi:hypothetical protein